MTSRPEGSVEYVDADGVVTYIRNGYEDGHRHGDAASAASSTQPATEQVLAATEVSLRKKARVALKSGYLPTSMYTEEQVIMIARAGEELGLPFITSLRTISLVEGKISLEAALMRALALRKVKGARILFRECSSQRCVVEMSRPSAAISVTYTIDDAQRADLLKKSTWKKNPISMLIARASAIGCRAIFGDALLGGSVYDPDELDRSFGVMSDEDVEIDRLRQEIDALSVALPPEKRDACFSQTNAAVFGKNLPLLRKIKDRVKSLLDAPAEEPVKSQEPEVSPIQCTLPGEAVTETTTKSNEEIQS